MFDRAKALTLVDAGLCACDNCGGTLTDAALSRGAWRFCRVCRCAWKVTKIDRQEYAAAIHVPPHSLRMGGADPGH